MHQRRPLRFLAALAVLSLAPSVRAQSDEAPAPAQAPLVAVDVEHEAVTAPPATPDVQEARQSDPAPAAGSTDAEPARDVKKAHKDDGLSDHQKAVGRWGIEARRVSSLNRSSASPDPRCTPQPCAVDVNAFGVRRWVHERYGWNAALALAVGGGHTVGLGSWDTHMGLGPQIGANFVLADSKHVVVSAVPQADFLVFWPSASGSKSYIFNLRALIEAEIHLGFINLPQLSVGTSAGLVFNYTKKTEPDPQRDAAGGVSGPPFSAWEMGMVGPQSLWGLVNDVFFRFYF